MADALTSITNLINSPSGQLAAGAALAGIVWKFFERVEAVLNDARKKEIAGWLLDWEPVQNMEVWPRTFTSMFDRLFRPNRESVSFLASWLASMASIVIVFSLAGTLKRS